MKRVSFLKRHSYRLLVRSIDIFLKQAISYLIETDYQIKTGLYEKGFLFEKALLQIASQVN